MWRAFCLGRHETYSQSVAGILLATARNQGHDLRVDMTPRPKIRRRRSASRHGNAKAPDLANAIGALVTTFILATILVSGPLILGAARLWIELPILTAVAALLVVQGLRLTAKPAPDAPRRADAIDLAVLLFVLYAVARWLTSPVEYFSRIEVMAVTAYAAVFLTCRHGMKSRKYCMAVLYALVLLGLGEMVFGYYLNNHLDWLPFGQVENLQQQFAPRWIGTYESPNHYVSLLVMATGAALALGSFSKLPWAVRILLFYGAIMMIVGVIFSGSRGGWLSLLAAIVGLVVMGIRNGTMRWWIPVVSGVVLLLFSAFLFSITPEAQARLAESQKLLANQTPATVVRVQAASETIQTAHDHLLFGWGPGTNVFVDPPAKVAPGTPPEPSRGDFLNCLTDYGVVGLGLALFFVVAVTLKFFRPLWVDNRWQDRVLVATGFAAWTALMVHSLVDFNLHIPANALLFFALTGLALGRIKEEKAGHWSTLTVDALGRWLGVAVVVFALIYGVEAARTMMSDSVLERAQAKARTEVVAVSESLADADQALRYDSGNVEDELWEGDLHRTNSEVQKDAAARQAEAQKAIDAYEQAQKENPLDASVQARIDAVRDEMTKPATQ
jgi:hypothetical protein